MSLVLMINLLTVSCYNGIIYVGSEKHENWNLRIDHCHVNIQAFRSGLFSPSTHTQGDSGNLVTKVHN